MFATIGGRQLTMEGLVTKITASVLRQTRDNARFKLNATQHATDSKSQFQATKLNQTHMGGGIYVVIS